MLYLAPIVEGQGEVACVPTLLYRLAEHLDSASITVNPPIRVKSGSFLKDHAYFHKYVGLAAAKASPHNGTVLILLDCDDGCPAQIAPDLLARAKQVRADGSFVVVLAEREYESWFLAGAKSLAGCHGLPGELAPPAEHWQIRDAKGWLGKRMPYGYDPIQHQQSFTRRFDIDEARKNPSFNRFFKRLGSLLQESRR